ncbi:MAG: hypothetical protein NZ700_13575, partial [Gemmataceae bacterium]|nr:hypothetical protein [Gemmataceae bacterium]MDW8265944.1 hypothetical protein [Gemmataceae bacterium]
MRLFVIAPALTLMTASLVLGWGKMPPVNQSRTLTELKYQEVLRNLAMMHRRNLARGAGVGPEVSAGPTPNGVSPPFVLQIDYLVQSECDALAPLPGDELRPRAPVLEPQRLLLLEYAYQKALGFRFDIPVEEKMAAFFGPRARLYAALQ